MIRRSSYKVRLAERISTQLLVDYISEAGWEEVHKTKKGVEIWRRRERAWLDTETTIAGELHILRDVDEQVRVEELLSCTRRIANFAGLTHELILERILYWARTDDLCYCGERAIEDEYQYCDLCGVNMCMDCMVVIATMMGTLVVCHDCWTYELGDTDECAEFDPEDFGFSIGQTPQVRYPPLPAVDPILLHIEE